MTILVRGHALSDQRSLDGATVADVFKTVRRERRLTQESAARGAGLTLSGYRPYEQGKRQLRLEQIPTFAKAFGVSIDTLSARLGLHGPGSREIRFAECADILAELDGEPPEVTETIINWLRQSVQIAKLRRDSGRN